MAKVDMKQVKELRDRTQAGLSDCKGALEEAGGDMEKAVEIILKKGLAKSAKRAGAIAAEGAVATRVSDDGKAAVIVEVNIQTDFAARNEDFLKFVDQVLGVAAEAKEGDDLGAKPAPEGDGTLEDVRKGLVARLGENINIRRWDRVTQDGPGKVQAYVHMGGKMGTVVALSASSDEVARKADFEKFAEEIAMQIVATAPLCVTASQIPEDEKKKQRDIFAAQLEEEGKVPEDKWPKVIDGKIAKWTKEVCLLDQPSVVETKKTVDQVREAVSKAVGGDVQIVSFVRYERGEGIEKKEDDFAAEAQKMSRGGE